MKCDAHIGNTAGVIFTDAVDVERQLAAALVESVHPQVGQAGPDGVLNAGKIERTDVQTLRTDVLSLRTDVQIQRTDDFRLKTYDFITKKEGK